MGNMATESQEISTAFAQSCCKFKVYTTETDMTQHSKCSSRAALFCDSKQPQPLRLFGAGDSAAADGSGLRMTQDMKFCKLLRAPQQHSVTSKGCTKRVVSL